MLRDPPGIRRALRLLGTVVRSVAPGMGPQPGFGVRWRAAESAAGVEPLGRFLVNELDIDGAAIRVTADGSRARFDFPGALPLSEQPDVVAAPVVPPVLPPRPAPPPPAAAAPPPPAPPTRPVPEPAVEPRAQRVRRPTRRMQRPGPAPVQPVPPAERTQPVPRRALTQRHAQPRDAPKPAAAAPRAAKVDYDETELIGLGGRAFFDRMATGPTAGAGGDVPERTSPEASGLFDGRAPPSSSIGRRLLSATGRLFGRGEEERPVDAERPASSGGWFYDSAAATSSSGRPISGIFAGSAQRSAPGVDVQEHSRGAKESTGRQPWSRLPEVIPPDVDIAAMVEVSVPVTYYVNDSLIPARLRRMGEDGMVIDAGGSVPSVGQPTEMHVPMWLEQRYVTLCVRMVPCIEPRVFGRVQRFIAAVLDVDDRHGVGMSELLAAEAVVRRPVPPTVVER